jgi:hypothetical protein
MPQTFNYAPHLSLDIQASIKEMIKSSFNVDMIWDKFIYDVEHESGELFTRVNQDSLMIRQDIFKHLPQYKRGIICEG